MAIICASKFFAATKKNEEQSSEQAEKGKIKIKEEVTAMRHNLENL